MNGPEVREVYYKQDGGADWLKSIVRTVYAFDVYDDPEYSCYGTFVEHGGYITFIESVAATRALILYYRETDITGGSHE